MNFAALYYFLQANMSDNYLFKCLVDLSSNSMFIVDFFFFKVKKLTVTHEVENVDLGPHFVF